MHSMKEKYPEGFSPDETWYKAFIGKAILFRTVQASLSVEYERGSSWMSAYGTKQTYSMR